MIPTIYINPAKQSFKGVDYMNQHTVGLSVANLVLFNYFLVFIQ